ncbi:MAG: glycosyltransferase [Rikenellaceae bacterium]|nr:glycosyltransferase [Rikenellaceae bacterium]
MIEDVTKADQQPLISVIVPIYGIERYIGLCIESIINQTYKNLEIILVDDGSPDRCPEICDLYAQKDPRIKVVHKKNGGLVSARKSGLLVSHGEYVGYVDGDDWLGAGFYSSLYTAILSSNADMVCAGYCRELFNKCVRFTNYIPGGIYEGERLVELKKSMASYGEFYRPGITTYVWNKLFKRSILYNHQMAVDEKITIGEDAAVTYPTLMDCERVCVTDCSAYHYRQREDSMLKKCAPFSSEAENLRYLHEYLVKCAKELDPSASYNLRKQFDDFVLGNCIMRSGGRLPNNSDIVYSTFDRDYNGKRVILYNAGTFGQQLKNRIEESGYCTVVGWVDDDYWEYRRCCINVDSVESLASIDFDYVLIATVDNEIAERETERLLDCGIPAQKILTVKCPEGIRGQLLLRYLYKKQKKGRKWE